MAFDPDAYLAAGARSPAPTQFDPNAYLGAQPDRSTLDTVMHKLGVGARAVGEGLAQFPGMIYDAAAAPVNMGISAFNAVTGSNRAQIPPAAQQVETGMNALGLPQPETRTERIMAAIDRGGASMMTPAAAGSLAANSMRPLLAATGEMLASQPGGAIASGMGGAGGSQTAKEMGYGPIGQAVGGLAGALAAPAITSAAAHVLSPQVSPAVTDLVDRGVYPPYGQMKGGGSEASENLAARLPIVGPKIKEADERTVKQFATAAINDALSPLGVAIKDGQTGNEAVAQARQILNGEYRYVLGPMKATPDSAFINNVAQAGTGVPADVLPQFQQTIQDQFKSIKGNLTGQDLQTARRTFENLAYATENDALSSAYQRVADAVTDLMKRSNPTAKDALDTVDSAWANFVRVRNAATREADRGTFNPAQLAAAARQMDRTAGKTAYSEGRAPMQSIAQTGIEVLGKNPVARGEPPLSLSQALAHPVTLVGSMARYPLYTDAGQRMAALYQTQRPTYARTMADALRYPNAAQLLIASQAR